MSSNSIPQAVVDDAMCWFDFHGITKAVIAMGYGAFSECADEREAEARLRMSALRNIRDAWKRGYDYRVSSSGISAEWFQDEHGDPQLELTGILAHWMTGEYEQTKKSNS